jgi:uncharacterized protein DUF6173
MSDRPGIIVQLEEILRTQPDLSEQSQAIAEINKQLDSLPNLADQLRLVEPMDTSRWLTEFQLPRIDVRDLRTEAQANYASEFYERLVSRIEGFNEALDEEHEVGVTLVNFGGSSIVFHLSDLGYWNPSLITFYGVTDDGNPVELIQHVSQISVLLTKLPRLPNEPKRVIGFHGDEASPA